MRPLRAPPGPQRVEREIVEAGGHERGSLSSAAEWRTVAAKPVPAS